ncbi:MAG: 2-amino-4-hydroxy-6-hydroxymethyldihydropteridine diphosphokinase [Verrucomicrobiota bacterium]
MQPSSASSQWAVVALGSNLGDGPSIIRQAQERLKGLSQGEILASSLWISSPVDCPPESPLFVNAAVAFTSLPQETPEALLRKLQQIEREFGRISKKVHNEPRPLDLDLVAFGREIRSKGPLVLPHPRAHLRRFVLAPLAEILPEWRLPGFESSISELLSQSAEDPALKRL